MGDLLGLSADAEGITTDINLPKLIKAQKEQQKYLYETGLNKQADAAIKLRNNDHEFQTKVLDKKLDFEKDKLTSDDGFRNAQLAATTHNAELQFQLEQSKLTNDSNKESLKYSFLSEREQSEIDLRKAIEADNFELARRQLDIKQQYATADLYGSGSADAKAQIRQATQQLQQNLLGNHSSNTIGKDRPTDEELLRMHRRNVAYYSDPDGIS